MAPSPELGQPKAPDKTDTTAMGTTATGGKCEDKTDSGDKYESLRIRKETEFSTTTTTTITTNLMTTTKQQDSENLSNLDERALEALLKEAITYKTPRDREHKSEMFRELLQDAEKENQKSDFSSYDLRYRKHKGSSRHTQGGSLQDLAETDNLDDIFGHNKKHYNLKQRHSSVSSRQREGGSLPSNVNVSFHNLMSFDTSCMFDVNLKKKCKNSGLHSMKQQQQQQQQLNSKDESQLYDSKIVGDTVIEIGDDESDDNQTTNIPYEPLQEELSDPINPEVDYLDVNPSLCQKLPRIQTQRQYTSQAKIEISETSPPRLINQSNADKTVSFSLLENSSNKNNVDMTPVQLNPSYSSVESIVGNKSTELNPRPTISANKFISANIFPQKLDVSDNSIQPFNASLPTSSQPNKLKYKKVPKSDRNTITVDYTKKEGFRGTDTINDLVRYIEAENETEKRRKENSSNNNGNSNNSNSNNPSNNNHNNNGAVLNSNNSNKKSKNNNNNSKKDSSSKLKKCNSLEELSSCSKLKELKESSNNSNTSSSSSSGTSSSVSSMTCQNQIQAEAVTLRTKSNTTKSKQNSDPNANIVITNSSPIPVTTPPNSNNSNNKKLVLIKKRSERRSWGTEELNYLGDSKVNSDYIKNNELLKTNSDDVNNNDDHESIVNNSGSNNINSLESNELISSHVNSMDASEFLLVTKKKKPKKIKLENNNNVNNNNYKNSGNNNNNNRGTNNRTKYNHNNSHMAHNAVTNQNNHHPHSNDRDLYLNSFNSADNNRRKSTSSVPPSERSDSSDLDSVHSLPVESIKSIQISPSTVSPPASTTKQSSNQISYADIAKIPNKHNTYVSTNNIDMLNNNMDTINTTPTTITENLLNKQLLYSKSLNEIKTPPNQITLHPQQPNGIIMSQIQNKNQFLLKSKSVDNDNYNVSIDQYPALEKTVKKNSNTNSIYISNPIIDNRMIKTSKKSPTPQNFVTTTISTPKKLLIEPIEVSQIEKSIVDELYNKPILNNNNNNKPAALKQVVVNNNNNANINKLNEFTVAPAVEILPIVVTPAPVMPVASISSNTTTSTTSKRPKKDKSNPTSVVLKNNINSNSSSSSNSNRPAVIILNDMDRDKPGNDITFGFEINQKLLFGDFNEEEMKLFETGTSLNTIAPTTTTTNNSDVSDYFSISDTSLELSGTMTTANNTQAFVSNSCNNNNNCKLQDTDNNQCDIINSVEQHQDVDKMNNNNNNLDNNNSLDKNDNFKKIREIDITKINFKAPNLNDIILTEHNHDKIVNFIESAWEDIISGTNGGAQYYNGQ